MAIGVDVRKVSKNPVLHATFACAATGSSDGTCEERGFALLFQILHSFVI